MRHLAKSKTEAQLKRDIIRILRGHVGRENAIDAGEIGRMIGIRENATHATTRGLITQIMREQDIPIGASSRGYFLLADASEFNEYIGELHARMAGFEERIANVSRAWFATHGVPIDDE